MEIAQKTTNCVRQYVETLMSRAADEIVAEWVRKPEVLVATYGAELMAALDAAGIPVEELRVGLKDAPFARFSALIPITDLPATPTGWVPIPSCRTTMTAMVSVVLLSSLFDLETVSYGSENDGHLFVNLVALPGEGAEAEQSTKAMRGHTDAATFPFRGTVDPRWPRIAPSPDIVYLAALRNPDAVPTIVMPLSDILARMAPEQIGVLKGPNIVIKAQKTFVRGTRAALGEVHVLDGTNVLHESEEGIWVRYTHKGTLPVDDEDTQIVAAKSAFEDACAKSVHPVVLAPGDLLMVNNRKALHGRLPVGDGVGEESRWLIRSYGLNTHGLSEDRRHASPQHKLFP